MENFIYMFVYPSLSAPTDLKCSYTDVTPNLWVLPPPCGMANRTLLNYDHGRARAYAGPVWKYSERKLLSSEVELQHYRLQINVITRRSKFSIFEYNAQHTAHNSSFRRKTHFDIVYATCLPFAYSNRKYPRVRCEALKCFSEMFFLLLTTTCT